jgi:hypothetical protein
VLLDTTTGSALFGVGVAVLDATAAAVGKPNIEVGSLRSHRWFRSSAGAGLRLVAARS